MYIKLLMIGAGLVGLSYSIFCIIFVDKYPIHYLQSGLLVLISLICLYEVV